MMFVVCSSAWNAVHQLSCDVRQLQKVWTDGASSNNQDARFRRAGSGIYYGDTHGMNLHVMVPGLLQSNQRAELLAVVLACLRDPRPLDIRPDSMFAKALHLGGLGLPLAGKAIMPTCGSCLLMNCSLGAVL